MKTRAITAKIFASCKLSVEKGHHSSQSVENSILGKVFGILHSFLRADIKMLLVENGCCKTLKGGEEGG